MQCRPGVGLAVGHGLLYLQRGTYHAKEGSELGRQFRIHGEVNLREKNVGDRLCGCRLLTVEVSLR
jgi:hypothetical protein